MQNEWDQQYMVEKRDQKKNSRNEIGGSDAKMVVFVRVINYHFFGRGNCLS